MMVTMATCVAALLLAGTGIIAYQLVYASQVLAQQLASRADLMGTASTAAVQFFDEEAGREALSAFRTDAEVEAARIDLADGTVFASYETASSQIPTILPLTGVERIGQTMIVSRPIVLDGRTIGAIRVQGSLARVQAQVARYVWILLAVLGASSLIAYFLSRPLQRVISDPIIQLAAVAEHVAAQRDYGHRATKQSDDELGQLVDRFNDMLGQIQLRDEALKEAHTQLEARVRERTSTLELEVLERRRAENELILAKSVAEEASVAKSAFLANMSHELRTPLNAIIGYSEMLGEDAEDRGDTEVQTDLLKITKAGHHLLSLITDVLDLSKIEAGRMELHLESVEAGEVVHAAVATSQSLATARNNELTVSGLDGLGKIRSDQTKVQQILLNLIGNACKFTSDGRVDLRCRREQGDAADWLVVDVNDTGIGMTPDQVSRLFREFMQADASTTRRFGGTGLGLAISQRLCRLMGGDITVHSVLGQGSTFTMRLPVEAPEPSRRSVQGVDREREALMSGYHRTSLSTSSSGKQPEPGAPRVLVIDDDQTSRELAARALEKVGFRTVGSSSASEGLRLAHSARPDAVIVDVLMPDTTGWALLQMMKDDPVLARIPVIVVSIVDDRSQSLSLGAAEHLVKPVVGERLVAVVRSVMAENQSIPQVAGQ